MDKFIEFSALEVNEIFEKKQKECIIEKIKKDFGEPCICDHKSGNTTVSGMTKWIREKKCIWKANNLEKFRIAQKEKEKKQDSKSNNQNFLNRVQQVYLVGLECKELPYFQVMIYVQFLLETETKVVTNSARLIKPFQIYLQNLNGLSNKVYESSLKPRFHVHHIVYSKEILERGRNALRELRLLQQNDLQYGILPTEHSKALRELPILQEFVLPTILTAINFYGNVLSFITHYEQFGGGGELQTYGVTIRYEHETNVRSQEVDEQQIAEKIRMFCPNLAVFDSATDAMNIHLFITGLLTWLAYFEKIREEKSEELECERERIQDMLNEKNILQISDSQNKLAMLLGDFASMGLLVSYVNNQIADQIDELASKKGMFGIQQTPIPQKNHDLFTNVFTNRTGQQAYFELVANKIQNNFSAIRQKLDAADNPANRMSSFLYNLSSFLYNQTSLKLQKSIYTNTRIDTILAVVISIFAGVSVIDFFGF